MAKLCIVAGPGGDNVKQMIIQEAKEFFETVTYVSIKKVRIALENGKSQAFYKDTSLDSFDAVWARGFFEDYRLMEILLDILEESTVFLVNSTEGFQVCNHKYLSIQAAVRLGLPVPDSYICVSPKIANELAEKIGFPAVVKLLSGFGGKGVMLANSKKEFLPLLETLTLFREFITGQEFVASEATDYRV
ncbi:ATP-grasp domain-containing protein, partial [Candidatus Micrarchaeota archaeon]|nr:ATP-grasp domain-containing protein [Candidatus Micrarchaeota archaeon]